MEGFSPSAMGYSLRFLVAKNGRVQKISAAKLNCVHFDGERWPEVAGQELKLMELALEVDRTRILRVLRVLPYRAQFDADGRPHPGELQNAHKRMVRALDSYTSKSTSVEREIAQLEADASYFWEPTEGEWLLAAELLGVRASDLKKAKFRPPDASD